MKSSEFHRIIRRSKKWKFIAAEGSHYIYENKEGIRYAIPFHGSKEIAEPLRKKIAKDIGV